MSNTHLVTATALNLRSQPKVTPATRVATLGYGQEVRKLADSATANWWQIETTLHGARLRGHVNSQYLAQISAAQAIPAVAPAGGTPPVHLTRSDPVTRSQAGRRAFALNEVDAPTRQAAANAANKVRALHTIIQWLQVDRSIRYAPGGGKTFCNIYVYDYCYLAKAFLPRVWWTRAALQKLDQGIAVTPEYGTTVVELNANSLYQWFNDFGDDFGWRRVASVDDLQTAANQGAVAIISGLNANPNRSGHIVAIAPETAAFTAQRAGGVVTRPVQSQAGASNFQYGGNVWWTSSRFQASSFWIHD